MAIVGGGLGGLAAGVALRSAGIACVVLERDASLDARRQGFGMTLNADERGPLGALNILKDCEALNSESRCHWVFDSRGHIRGYFGRGLDASNHQRDEERRGNLRVQREQLRRILYDRYVALGGLVRWGTKVEAAIDGPDFVSVKLSEGKENFAAVVGADGVRSVVRTWGPPLEPVGVAVVVGLSTHRHPLIERQGFYVLDGRARLFTMPFSNDLTMWQLSYAEASSEPTLQTAVDLTRHWQVQVAKDLIEHTVEVWATNFVDRDEMPLDGRRLDSRITVLGDACHPMTCFKGAGANQALADAITLAKCLADCRHVPRALRRFEREMVQRAAPRAAASRVASRFLHSPAALLDVSFPHLDHDRARRLCEELEKRRVCADDADCLEERVAAVLREEVARA